MKKTFILCCMAIIAAAPVCLAQATSSKLTKKGAASESTITDLEKSAWEAYKNKKADAFKALLSADYCGVYVDGTKTLDGEVANIAKTDLSDYSFADVKVVFPHPKVAVITYKATQHATLDGKDISGTYNAGSVWVQKGGKWVGVFHTDIKAQ